MRENIGEKITQHCVIFFAIEKEQCRKGEPKKVTKTGIKVQEKREIWTFYLPPSSPPPHYAFESQVTFEKSPEAYTGNSNPLHRKNLS